MVQVHLAYPEMKTDIVTDLLSGHFILLTFSKNRQCPVVPVLSTLDQ